MESYNRQEQDGVGKGKGIFGQEEGWKAIKGGVVERRTGRLGECEKGNTKNEEANG